jgi:mRNA interferase HigB
MRIVTFATIRECEEKHPEASVALRDWYTETKDANWSSLVDMKNTFYSVDYVTNNRYVFNIKGNDFRLVAIVIFPSKKVYIRFMDTHKACEKIDCKTI